MAFASVMSGWPLVAVCCVSSWSCEFLYSVSLTELGVVISGDAGVVDEL
jgi:hypothetical protein